MMRLATTSDLDIILKITKDNQKVMNEIDNIKQWDDGYPNLDVFKDDLKNEQLYVLDINNKVVGFIVLNTHEYEQYNEVKWSSDLPCLVIHRFAVDIDSQKNGYGSMLLQGCIEICKSKNINYLKIDTSSNNNKMNSVIVKNGFKFKGTMNLKGNNYPLWNCYDLLF